MPVVNCITINTDASFNQKRKIGTYAFYIVYNHLRIKKGGIYKKQHPENPIDSEMMAMANAFHFLSLQKDLPKTKKIIINSDCLTSFKRISENSKSKVGRIVFKKLQALRIKTAINELPAFEFRHVKSHNGTPDSRSFANDWCDKEAKRWMGIAISKFNN